MGLLSFIRMSAVDVATAALSCVTYGVALSSTAIGGFWSGPDFDHAPMSGLECLVTGWLFYPLGWLANPVMLAGIALLLARYRILALFMALAAVGLALSWASEFSREFSPTLLMPGYAWWLGSMQILTVGSLCSMVVHYPDTLKSLRLRR